MCDLRWALFLTIVCTVIGFIAGVDVENDRTMRRVEHTIQESVQTGKPFIFESGRMGLIKEVHYARNGKTIAYRVISFTWPEGK